MTVTMATLSDDKAEQMLSFVRMIAGLNLYGSEMSDDNGEDAMDAMNQLIEEARDLLISNPKEA